jgi:hypothetical protein
VSERPIEKKTRGGVGDGAREGPWMGLEGPGSARKLMSAGGGGGAEAARLEDGRRHSGGMACATA